MSKSDDLENVVKKECDQSGEVEFVIHYTSKLSKQEIGERSPKRNSHLKKLERKLTLTTPKPSFDPQLENKEKIKRRNTIQDQTYSHNFKMETLNQKKNGVPPKMDNEIKSSKKEVHSHDGFRLEKGKQEEFGFEGFSLEKGEISRLSDKESPQPPQSFF
ncbi:hypothetical protein M0812_05912 [Anaeramoeba flamelloides]|uniref:Uncharacterized protein n=1 Tax=Anaeramoeba flamelloides TaxID=1746091 RepID=A0AAV8A611_9EUKA|nr:hypothetical protein M0812_05912 [Anaeramoeba flamelloides]